MIENDQDERRVGERLVSDRLSSSSIVFGRAYASSMEGFERVASVDDLPADTPVAVELASGQSVCLVKVDNNVYALQDRCTHAEFPMSEGDMVDDYVIECGLHGARFDIRTGSVLDLPAEEDLECYTVKVVDGVVWVRENERDSGVEHH